MQKKCLQCWQDIIRTHWKANNKKYCSVSCRGIAYAPKRKKFTDEANHKRWSQYETKKIQCVICWGWYVVPCWHVYRRHWVNEAEYKKMIGVDHKKGLIPQYHYELIRDNALAHGMDRTLKLRGIGTQFKPWDPRAWNYERSPQTIKNLKVLYKTNKYRNKNNSNPHTNV